MVCQNVNNPPVFCLLVDCQPVLCLLRECTLVHCMQYFASQYLAYLCKTSQYLPDWYFNCDVLCPRVVCQLYFAHCILPSSLLPFSALHVSSYHTIFDLWNTLDKPAYIYEG